MIGSKIFLIIVPRFNDDVKKSRRTIFQNSDNVTLLELLAPNVSNAREQMEIKL